MKYIKICYYKIHEFIIIAFVPLDLLLDLSISNLCEWLSFSKMVLFVFSLFPFETFAKDVVGFIYLASSYAWQLNYYYV